MDSKPWYASKTVWAAVVALVSGALALTGKLVLSPETQQAVIDGGIGIATSIVTIISAAIAIYGRVKADTVIKPTTPSVPPPPARGDSLNVTD